MWSVNDSLEEDHGFKRPKRNHVRGSPPRCSMPGLVALSCFLPPHYDSNVLALSFCCCSATSFFSLFLIADRINLRRKVSCQLDFTSGEKEEEQQQRSTRAQRVDPHCSAIQIPIRSSQNAYCHSTLATSADGLNSASLLPFASIFQCTISNCMPNHATPFYQPHSGSSTI